MWSTCLSFLVLVPSFPVGPFLSLCLRTHSFWLCTLDRHWCGFPRLVGTLFQVSREWWRVWFFCLWGWFQWTFFCFSFSCRGGTSCWGTCRRCPIDVWHHRSWRVPQFRFNRRGWFWRWLVGNSTCWFVWVLYRLWFVCLSRWFRSYSKKFIKYDSNLWY